MAEMTRVCSVGDIPVGTGLAVEVGGKQVAVFNIDGSFYAIDNVCRHRNGPLAEGEIEGTVVACPWHGWTYDVTTGVSPEDPDCANDCYEIRVDGDAIFVGGVKASES